MAKKQLCIFMALMWEADFSCVCSALISADYTICITKLIDGLTTCVLVASQMAAVKVTMSNLRTILCKLRATRPKAFQTIQCLKFSDYVFNFHSLARGINEGEMQNWKYCCRIY